MMVSRRSMLAGCVALGAAGLTGLGAVIAEVKKPTVTVYKEPT